MDWTLQAHLATMPYKALRGMATRLGLRQRPQGRKREWIAVITAGWQQAAQQHAWLHALSPAAHVALRRLIAAEQLPATLFWATYGGVRLVTANQHWSPPPWQAPTCVSEELYYSGLLCPLDGASLTRAQWLTLPVDLRTELASLLTTSTAPLSPVPLPPVPLPGWPLCHDVGQWLIYLHSQPGLRLQHGRWLTRAQVGDLNERLWQPLTEQPLPTHRHSPYLQLISFLAEEGELQTQGRLTPKGWDWLATAPAMQLAWLWQAWCAATAAQRQRYALPDGAVGAPWPQPLLRQLCAPPLAQVQFTAADLVHGLLRNVSTSAAFWAANFHHLADLEQVVAQTLTATLAPLGVVAATGPGLYQITPAGALLLEQPSSPKPDEVMLDLPPALSLHESKCKKPSGEQWSDAGDPASYYGIDFSALPSPATLHAQAQLAQVGTYTPSPARSRQAYHRYELTAATLARAAAAGYGLPNLLEALAQSGLVLTPPQYEQLAAWHAQGRQLTLMQAPLLRTTTPAQLATISQSRALQPALGEIVAPTVAIITTDLAAFAEQLQRQGYYAAAPALQPDTPPATTTETTTETTMGNAAELGTLWLAGRLYAHLGAHLALPLPPPFAALDRLLTSLSAPQQAVLQAQAAQLHEQLLNLLDNLPFTPPPHPTDPAHWRPLLTQAMDTKARLQLTYFSAGRNLTTRRLIDPYWIEEHRTIPYLRAYCHSAGRVLTFRLDRIVELETVEQ